jgi:GH25 family lysozyme M1 (1,4-beta-N-acetylmuramidase)/5-hydroxyisourate hydrolase-like protein (transthyretin family)
VTSAADASAAVSADTAVATDTAADDSSGFGNDAISGATASSDTYSGNPTVELPSTIDDSVSDDDTMVAGSYAQKDDGTVVDVTTGEVVTDPDVVGTSDAPADPLAKTDGESFIPVSVGTVRSEIESDGSSGSSSAGTGSGSTGSTDADSTDTGSTDKASVDAVNSASATASSADSAATSVSSATLMSKSSADSASLTEQTQPNVTQTSLQNMYGAYWGTYNGTSAFYNKGGSLFVQQAKGVVDVSQWQGTINWTKAKAAGVQGAIIRIGYGQGNWDTTAKRNISECKRLGIPFGIYLYSYAYSSAFAKTEGTDLAKMLKSVGITGKTSYPIYYDLEAWSWTGHAHPTSPSVYNGIVNSWYSAMKAAGYTNLGVYSYTSYLSTALNNSNIYAKTSWVAEYGPKMNFAKFGSNARGWQYSSSGSISGISGSVDINAFGNKTYVGSTSVTNVTKMTKVSIPNGNYYINAVGVSDAKSVDIPGASKANQKAIDLYSYNNTKAQQFTFTKQSDGSYVIKNVNSGMALDVASGKACNKAVVRQYTANGTTAQKWFIRNSGNKYYLQSALGNWVLDIAGGKTANKTAITLYTPNASKAQQFGFASVASLTTGEAVKMSPASSSSLAVDIPASSKSNGVKTQLYQWNGTNVQTYKLTPVGNGIFRFTNVNSGKVLDVPGNSSKQETPVQQYSSNNSVAQHWSVRTYGSNKFAFVGVGSGKALDIPGGHVVSGAKLRIYTLNGSQAQQFSFTRVSTLRNSLDTAAAKHRSAVSDGTYLLRTKSSGSLQLDVASASQKDSANVQIYTANNTEAQMWTVTHDSKGYVTLTNKASGKALNLVNNAIAGANVNQYSQKKSYSQKWIGIKNSDGSYSFESAVISGLSLEQAKTPPKSGVNVRVGKTSTASPQKWVLKKLSESQQLDMLASANKKVLADGTYTIASKKNSTYVVDVAGASTKNGANVRLYKSNDTKAQKWKVTHDAEGYVVLINVGSGKALDVAGAKTASGTNVDQYTKNGTKAQRWIAVKQSGGGVKLISGVKGTTVLDLAAGKIANATNIRVYTPNGTTAQSWVFKTAK